MFYLHVEILRHGYLVLTAGFCKHLHHRFIDIPSSDRRTKVCRWIYDVNGCKNKRWAPNIHGVKFQRVDRKIFIKCFINAYFSLFTNFDFFLLSYNPLKGGEVHKKYPINEKYIYILYSIHYLQVYVLIYYTKH